MEKNYSINNSNNEELTFSVLFRILNRNKLFISTFTIIVFLISCIVGLSKKKVWEGYFSIVLENKKSSGATNSVLSNFNIPNFAGLNLRKNSLETEVGILGSNSVLIPIYNYANKEYLKLNKNEKGLSFNDWKKNLNIGLEKKTSILNVRYKDTNKEIILPILLKISEAYQDYSGRSKTRSVEIGKSYLDSQIKLFKDKSANSSREALTYAIENNLTTNDTEMKGGKFNPMLSIIDSGGFRGLDNFLPLPSFDGQPSRLTEGDSLEAIRIRSANEIKNIELQIAKIKKISNIKDLQYIGSTIEPLREEGLPQTLELIEAQLIDLNSKYTKDDQSIKNLELKRDIYSKLLKDRTIGYLKARKLAAEARMESSKRPKGVLIKGKELMREANRDQETLVELENKLRMLKLSEAKYEDPWELITKPTLGRLPIAPQKRKIAYFGLLIGLFLGSLISYLREKLSRLIYEEKELENLSNTKIIKRLKLTKNEIQESPNEILIEEIQSVKDGQIIIIESSQVNRELSGVLNSYLRKLSKNNNAQILNCTINDNFSTFNRNNSLILLTSLGKITETEVNNLMKRLEILNKSLDAIILIETTI